MDHLSPCETIWDLILNDINYWKLYDRKNVAFPGFWLPLVPIHWHAMILQVSTVPRSSQEPSSTVGYRMTSASRTILLGILLGLAANGLHLLASYLVKVNPISAADNLIFRASTQFVGFGIWTVLDSAYKRKKRSNDQGLWFAFWLKFALEVSN